MYFGQCQETPNPSAVAGCGGANSGYCTAAIPCCSASAVCSANKCTVPCNGAGSVVPVTSASPTTAQPSAKPTARPTAAPSTSAAPSATAAPSTTAAPSAAPSAPVTLVQVVQGAAATIVSVQCFDVHGVSVPGGTSADGFLTTTFNVGPSGINTCDVTGPQAAGSSVSVFAGPSTASPLAWSRALSGAQFIYTVFQLPAPDTSAGAVCAKTGGVSFTTTLASLTSLLQTSTTVTVPGAASRQTTLQSDFENLFNPNHVRCTAYNFVANTWTGCATLTALQLSTRATFREANLAGALLRAAFHDAGEFKADASDSFGPDGCLSTVDGRNSGLMQSAVTLLMTDIEQIWQRYCDRITRADLWALFGKWAAERQEPTRGLRVNAAGALPSQPVMYIPFAFGRRDNARCNEGSYRLPQHQPGLPEYQRASECLLRLDSLSRLCIHALLCLLRDDSRTFMTSFIPR